MIYIEYVCGQKKLEIELSGTDIEALEQLKKNRDVIKSIDLLFDCESPGEAVDIEFSVMLQAITAVARESLSSDYGYNYEYDVEIGGRMMGYSAGTYKGFRIRGDIYEIEAGYEKLDLHRYGPVENNRHYIVQTVDIRDRSSIDIDGGKRILIRKRKVMRRLAKIIGAVHEFIRGLDGANITKTVTD